MLLEALPNLFPAVALSEFGVCRARKDGRNLYCKSCIRKKVTESRRALKEYRSARKRYVSQPSSEAAIESESSSTTIYNRLLSKLTPVERGEKRFAKAPELRRKFAMKLSWGR